MKLLNKFSLLPSLLLLLLWFGGCATQQPYDYSALKRSSPRSILVIPPLNNTVEASADYAYLSTISRPLAEKGYYVFPVAVIDHFLKENGLPTPAEMNNIPLGKIAQYIGADAVLYVTIDDWGQSYQVLSSVAKVSAKIKLVDVKTGEQLWDAPVFAQESSGDGGGGLFGALINAIIGQIAGSLSDKSTKLALHANSGAINNSVRGLLNGPYKPVDKKEK